MKFAIMAAIVVAFLPCLSSQSFPQSNAEDARRSAIKILLGDPYGKTPAAVSNVIVSQKLVPDAHCNSHKTVWEFLIVVPSSKNNPDGISGYLLLDQRASKLICAGLPYLG